MALLQARQAAGGAPGGPPGPGGPVSPPGQLGGGTMPSGNAGLAVKAMSDVRNAVTMLESALPHIPMGSELHGEVLNATKGLLKHLQSGDQNQSIDLMSLLQMARQNAQSQPMQALMKAYPQNPGAPPAPGAGGGLAMAA